MRENIFVDTGNRNSKMDEFASLGMSSSVKLELCNLDYSLQCNKGFYKGMGVWSTRSSRNFTGRKRQ